MSRGVGAREAAVTGALGPLVYASRPRAVRVGAVLVLARTAPSAVDAPVGVAAGRATASGALVDRALR